MEPAENKYLSKYAIEPSVLTLSLPRGKVMVFQGTRQSFLFQDVFGTGCIVTYPNAAN